MFQPTSPITGASVTGLTSPTYTHASDVPPSAYGKQIAVTALGGTQTNVQVHSAASPFTGMFSRPSVLKSVIMNSNGTVKSVPTNTYKLVARKGGLVSAGVTKTAIMRVELDIPAGMESYDENSLNALLSFSVGLLTQQLQGIKDTAKSGLL